MRNQYGRLVAVLARRFGDLEAAEDALSDALASALGTWPGQGVPVSPEAWLFTAAKHRLESWYRRVRVRREAEPDLRLRAEEAELPADADSIEDERLGLLFACAHPAIEETIRTPLMLQAVLGLDAVRIGAAFLVQPKSMGQRLVRAKVKIREAKIPLEVPERHELSSRLEDVLRAIYVAYGTGWHELDGEPTGLTEEAIFLGRLVVRHLPNEPEALGLLSLMLFCEARAGARRDEQGGFVPLAEQDSSRWSRQLIIEADALLTQAARAARFGRFQCEAAIQSLHVQRGATGVVRHDALRTLYDLLLAHVPATGVAVARAAALAEAGDVAVARAALDELWRESAPQLERYQPYWVTRSRVALLGGDAEQARGDLLRGIELTEHEPVRRYLERRLTELGS